MSVARCIVLITLKFSLVCSSAAKADWLFNPYVSLQGIYTDNLRLTPADEAESDFIIDLSPGFTLQRETSRFNLDVDYAMQNLFYTRNSNENETTHQLTGDATLEFWRDRLFVNVNGLVDQYIIDPQNLTGSDNINITNNLTDVYAFRINPYWQEDFGGYADFFTGYSYDLVRYSQGAADSDIQTLNVRLNSGRRFTTLDWQLSYSNQQIDSSNIEQDPNNTAANNDRENFLGEITYSFSDVWAVNGRFGYEDNNLDGNVNGVNGSFWSLGATWTPSRYITATVLYGPDDKEITLQYNPSARTSISVSRRDRSVGLTTGVVWAGIFRHRTRYSVWSASYTDNNVSGGTLIFDDPLADFEDDSDDPDDLIAEIPDGTDLTLTSSDFRRKRFETRFTYTRARTSLSINGYLEKRTFDTNEDEEVYGFGAAFNRNFGPRTLATLSTTWSNNESNDQGIIQESDLWTFQGSLRHVFSDEFTGSLGYRFSEQNSNTGLNYQENRIFLLMQIQF